jgi:succinate-semialdehyde dehydrogenase/glutarate-semialdehyde dehydrogenase
MTFETVNPATGESIRSHDEHSDGEVEKRLELAVEGFAAWREAGLGERAERLRAVSRLLRQGKERLGLLATQEMGKPLAEAAAEVEKCAWACDWYAEHAAELLAPEPRASDARESSVRFEPLGPLLAIMPWNFPFWQVFRFAAPALAAGNTVLLKPAPNVPACALAIEGLFEEAGFPGGSFQTLFIAVPAAGRLIADPRIRGVTLTGSDRAGASVGEAAGRAVKKVVLELGGSDPFLVLEDADVESAAQAAVAGRMVNSGQSCIAAKRFIVHRRHRERFEDLLRDRMERLAVGDPLSAETQVGPLARLDLLENLDRQVKESIARGARLLTGGERLRRPGFFYAPTVLADVRPGMAVADEETFGPVAPVLEARDEEEAVALANATPYGLGASIWTRDGERAKRLAARLEAGFVAVNGLVKSDPRLPFGGVKRSGYGRELSREGIREFVNVKTVVVH